MFWRKFSASHVADVIIVSQVELEWVSANVMGPCNEELYSETFEHAGVHFIKSLVVRILSHMQSASARDLAVV